MYEDEIRLDFRALGQEIKRKRKAKGWTQEYLAQLIDRTPHTVMYILFSIRNDPNTEKTFSNVSIPPRLM